MQQYVCPGMQQMRLRLIKPNANAATARITRRELQQRLFQRFFTLTNYANLQDWVLIQRSGYRRDRHVGHLLAGQATRSEARSVGKECVSTWRARGSPDNKKKT